MTREALRAVKLVVLIAYRIRIYGAPDSLPPNQCERAALETCQRSKAF